jgi:predicted enzyme related to lactoylglutathione lyase
MTELTSYEQGRFSWVDLMTPDAAEAKRFYCGLLGWEAMETSAEESGGGAYTQFMLRDRPVAGMGEMSPEMKQSGMPPVWNSYVNVEDVKPVTARVSELGGSVSMPAMQIMTVGRMAIYTDPQGAAFSVWQAQDHIGAGIVNEPGSFCWNELATSDLAAARSFYGDLFGWQFKESGGGDPPYTEIHLGERGNGSMLPLGEAMQGVPPHWAVYFSVEDCEKSVAKLADLSGQVVMPPTRIEPGTFAICSDPRGGLFSLIALTLAD